MQSDMNMVFVVTEEWDESVVGTVNEILVKGKENEKN